MSQPTARKAARAMKKFKAPMIKENKMMNQIHIVNHTSELKDCRKEWTYNKDFSCWCLWDILYTKKPAAPKFQRMSIFVPAPYMADGELVPEGRCGNYKAINAPVVFENNSAGLCRDGTYETRWRPELRKELSGSRNGLCYLRLQGARRQLRMELLSEKHRRFLWISKWRYVFSDIIKPFRGDLGRIISIGWSAGGAMSSLLGG